MTTARERFEKACVGDMDRRRYPDNERLYRGMYVNHLVEAAWDVWQTAEREAMKIFWPPRPSQEQLAEAGVEIVGEEPCMVQVGEYFPLSVNGACVVHPHHAYTNGHDAPVFVWLVRKLEVLK